MDEVKIHSGTRVKMKKLDEDTLSPDFYTSLREFALKQESVEAVYLFALQPEGQEEQICLALAIRKTFFGKQDEEFLRLVDEVQLLLPSDLSLNLYRFGASDLLARFCLESLEPAYVSGPNWLGKQVKKYLR